MRATLVQTMLSISYYVNLHWMHIMTMVKNIMARQGIKGSLPSHKLPTGSPNADAVFLHTYAYTTLIHCVD